MSRPRSVLNKSRQGRPVCRIDLKDKSTGAPSGAACSFSRYIWDTTLKSRHSCGPSQYEDSTPSSTTGNWGGACIHHTNKLHMRYGQLQLLPAAPGTMSPCARCAASASIETTSELNDPLPSRWHRRTFSGLMSPP